MTKTCEDDALAMGWGEHKCRLLTKRIDRRNWYIPPREIDVKEGSESDNIFLII